ncbi:MAG: hypothetical protein IKH41_06700 [Clostridia bacterium]|nr:hypothetical protein [Clostridia bacterium]
MKKYLFIAFAITIVLALSSCGYSTSSIIATSQQTDEGYLSETDKSYSIFIEASSDNLSLCNYNENYDFKDTETFQNVGIDSEKEVTFNGKYILGRYKKTVYFAYNYLPTFIYGVDSDVEFGVDPYGKIVYWYDNNAINQSQNDIVLSKKECEEIATLFFRSVVDLNHYSVFVEEEDNYYEFEFTKYKGSIKTTDRANIIVSKSGSIVSYRAELIDMIDVNAIDEIDISDIKEAIFSKVNEFLGDSYINKEKEIQIDTIILTLLKEGFPAVVANVRVIFSEERGEYALVDLATLRLVVFLDKTVE